jgi:hypothetical protein
MAQPIGSPALHRKLLTPEMVPAKGITSPAQSAAASSDRQM